MKRLLAYLFIVLGLGLTFSASAHAFGKKYCVLNNYDFNTFNNSPTIKITDIFLGYYKDGNKKKDNCGKGKKYRRVSKKNYDILQERYLNEINFKKKKEIQLSKKLKKSYKNDFGSWKFGHEICKVSVDSKWEYYFAKNNICAEKSHEKIDLKKSSYDFAWSQTPSRNLEKSHDFYLKFLGKKILTPEEENRNELKILKAELENLKKNQIAKAEPSQTQKVARKNIKYPELLYFPDINSGMKLPNIANEGDVYKFLVTNLTNNSKWFESINSNKNIAESEALNKCKKYFKDTNTDDACLINSISILNENSNNIVKQYFVWDQQKLLFYDKTKTQIAKAEPSQTQKVAGKEERKIKVCFSEVLTNQKAYGGSLYHSNDLHQAKSNCTPKYNHRKLLTYKQVLKKNPNMDICYRPNYKIIFLTKTNQGRNNSKPFTRNCKELFPDSLVLKHLSDNLFTVSNQTQIAKVEGSKQEEFKHKKTNQDNEAPVITIAEAITVDSQAYTLKGKVKDKSQIYLTINGRQVNVKKGKFELDRFSIDPDVAEELKIVAIDQWNNKSEKIVKVTIDLQSTDIAKVYEELKPNNVKVKTDNNKIAIIIGIEKYENLTNLDAKYANRDAKAFRAYATRALGIKPSNIKILIDDKATRSQALKAFKLWLPKIAGKGGKDIHIFFAGHGLASDNGEDLYILPQDGESSLLEDTAISRVELISLINKVNPKSVTMFFDTCYSGQTRDERMLVASLRPIRIVADEQETPDNFTIFTASNYDQTSGSIEEAEHGMFSYYLMKGLEGNADVNGDRKITNGELIAYLKENVSQEAFTQNRQQDPMLAGDPDKILIKF